MTRAVRFGALVLATWLALALCALLNVFPYYPRTATAWVLFVAIAPAAVLGLDWVGSRIASSPFLSRRSSIARVALGVLIVAAVGALAFFVTVTVLGR